MTMLLDKTLYLKGRITEDGKLEVDLPPDLPAMMVDVTIAAPDMSIPFQSDEDSVFTDEEIREMLTFTPMSGQEIVRLGLYGGWENKGIDDPVAWLEQRRSERRKKRESR